MKNSPNFIFYHIFGTNMVFKQEEGHCKGYRTLYIDIALSCLCNGLQFFQESNWRYGR